MKKQKPIISVGAGKGKLLSVLEKFLSGLNIDFNHNGRKLVYDIETEKYILKICLIRWEDIKRYSNSFDMIIYGADQWLESGRKSMIALEYFEQENCRISLLVNNKLSDKPLKYFKKRKVATGYPTLAQEYLGVPKENIVYMSGSVEAAVPLGWTDSIFDVVESGKTAAENGLVEYKTLIKFGAILATSRPEKIPLFESLGLIKPLGKSITVAFDGIEGSGKSTLSKHLVQNGLWSDKAAVLISAYSGSIGTAAKALWDSKRYLDWATVIGINHWRAPANVNAIYDRSILTFMTDLIKVGTPKEDILKVIETWSPLPDVLFYCDLDTKTAFERVKRRGNPDQFDSIKSLNEYHELYKKAVEFLQENNVLEIVRLDVSKLLEENIQEVKDVVLKKLENK